MELDETTSASDNTELPMMNTGGIVYRLRLAQAMRRMAMFVAVAFLALAPFLCLRFCEVRHAWLRRAATTDRAMIALQHAMGNHSSPNQRASGALPAFPLEELQQMLSSFMEVVSEPVSVSVTLLMALLYIAIFMRSRPTPAKVPTPPPRFALP